MRPVLGVAVGAIVPTAVTLVRHGYDLRSAWLCAALLGGAGLAFAVDDDAAVLLASSPTPLMLRRAARVLAAAVPIAAAWFVVIGLSAATNRIAGASAGLLAVEALTAAGVALAVAGFCRRAGNAAAGFAGFVSALLAMVFVTAFSMQYAWLPRIGAPTHHARWLWVAAAAWTAAICSARDEARQH